LSNEGGCKLPLGTVENNKSLLIYEGLDDIIIYHPTGEIKPIGGFLYDKGEMKGSVILRD